MESQERSICIIGVKCRGLDFADLREESFDVGFKGHGQFKLT